MITLSAGMRRKMRQRRKIRRCRISFTMRFGVKNATIVVMTTQASKMFQPDS